MVKYTAVLVAGLTAMLACPAASEAVFTVWQLYDVRSDFPGARENRDR